MARNDYSRLTRLRKATRIAGLGWAVRQTTPGDFLQRRAIWRAQQVTLLDLAIEFIRVAR